jgi:glycosyltransferase involved in cell wall biosynthesis
VVDLTRYVRRPDSSAQGPAADEVVIGWIGTPITVRYLGEMREVLEKVTKSGGVRLHIIGASVPAELAGLPAVSVPWNEATEVQDISRFSIGIMPLTATPWEMGKCGFKLLQVMAAGLPVVASAIGVNAQIVRHGATGFLASNAEEWSAAIATLCADRTLRQKMGLEARKTVEQNYSLDAVIDSLASVLDGVLKGGQTLRPRLRSGANLGHPARPQNQP